MSVEAGRGKTYTGDEKENVSPATGGVRMSHEMPIIMLQPSGPVDELLPPPPPAGQLSESLATPSPEQIRAVEAVFAQQQKESATVANLLGLYTSGVMLHNLVTDSLTPAAEEAKKKPQLKKEDEPQD